VTRDSLSAEFVGPPGRRILVLGRSPAGAADRGGSVLVVPPFGEEMNKSRHLIADAMRRLCEAGVAAFLPDLYGTGDSEGGFRDASVELWLEDLSTTCRHAEASGRPVRAILAVRLGCALAATAARRGVLPAVAASVWWQPVLDGKRFLQQFLRLRVAAAGMRGDAQETVDSLRARSAAGETLEVAGYELSPALVQGLEALAVDALPTQAGDLQWIEVVRNEGDAPQLPSTRFVDRARAIGSNVAVAMLASEPFWGATELVRLPRLAELTAAALVPVPAAMGLRPAPDSRVNA
jgi:exosortase A-associated hydrolase 2